jgi:hypothetical protein
MFENIKKFYFFKIKEIKIINLCVILSYFEILYKNMCLNFNIELMLNTS